MARAPKSRPSTPIGDTSAGAADGSEHLADLFAVMGGADIRRMFGGRGVFRDGLMFALQVRDDLYLKVDAPFSQRLAELGSSPFQYAGATREVTLPYWRLPDSALDDDDLRRDLLLQALAVAHAAAARKAPRSKAAKSSSTKGRATLQAPGEDLAGSTPPDFDALGLGVPSTPTGSDRQGGRAPRAAGSTKAPKKAPKRRGPAS